MSAVLNRLQSFPSEQVAVSALETLNAIQFQGPQEQLLGLACAFMAMCRACEVDSREVFYIIARMEADARWRNVFTLDAVQQYCNEEIKKKLCR